MPEAVEVVRRIPIPTSVSPQAQQFLSAGFGMGGAQAESPKPDDVDGWRALIAMADEGLTAMFDATTADVPLTVEATEQGGVPVFVITPDGAPDGPDAPIFFNVHGGAFYIGGGDACRAMGRQMTADVQLRTWCVDYRMPPDHPYPAAVDDCLSAYRALLEVKAPDRIIVGGQSAGGNIAAALMLRARDEGLPLPAGLVLLTPEVDLTESGDSFATMLGLDVVLTASLAESIALYAGDHDLTDPYLSPLFGDFTRGYPPTMLQAGTRDLFLSNAVRLHRGLRAAGIDAELHVFEAMPHGGFFGAPEDAELAAEVRRFIAARLDR